MYVLCSKIEIKSKKTWVFDKITSAEVVRDTESLTDTCVVELPKKVRWKDEPSIPVRRGDEITVHLGYDGHLQLAFKGFITAVGTKSPVRIECEDYMFRLKQHPAKKLTYKSATLDRILTDQCLGIRHKVSGEQNIGQYRVTADTVSGLLADLKTGGGIRSFIRYEDGEPVLHCGVLFDRPGDPGGTNVSSHTGNTVQAGTPAPTQVFSTGLNLIDDSQLEEQTADSLKIKVKAISMMPDNKKITVEAGDRDGELRTLHTYNKQEPELKAWAEQELKRLKRDGLAGSFTTFGNHLVEKLDAVGIRIDGQRKGVYQVRKNEIKYGDGGLRQEITIGTRVAE